MTTDCAIENDTIIQRNEEILSSSINNETVMMDIESGQYIGLDPIATRIWALIEQPISFGQLCETLTSEYDVSMDQCKMDVATFLDKSTEANLVTFSSVAVA